HGTPHAQSHKQLQTAMVRFHTADGRAEPVYKLAGYGLDSRTMRRSCPGGVRAADSPSPAAHSCRSADATRAPWLRRCCFSPTAVSDPAPTRSVPAVLFHA